MWKSRNSMAPRTAKAALRAADAQRAEAAVGLAAAVAIAAAAAVEAARATAEAKAARAAHEQSRFVHERELAALRDRSDDKISELQGALLTCQMDKPACCDNLS